MMIVCMILRGYLKSDIIELHDVAFRGDTEEARLIKGLNSLGVPRALSPQLSKSMNLLFSPSGLLPKEYKE